MHIPKLAAVPNRASASSLLHLTPSQEESVDTNNSALFRVVHADGSASIANRNKSEGTIYMMPKERRHTEVIRDSLAESTAAITRCYNEVSDLYNTTEESKRAAFDLSCAVNLLRHCLPFIDDATLASSVKCFIRKLKRSAPPICKT
ncbi:MAG: hypothetical protein DDT26_01706 [Dehalococcoidia bacterium]|nr:hypothetical protein [Chloroflexota bacterium]